MKPTASKCTHRLAIPNIRFMVKTLYQYILYNNLCVISACGIEKERVICVLSSATFAFNKNIFVGLKVLVVYPPVAPWPLSPSPFFLGIQNFSLRSESSGEIINTKLQTRHCDATPFAIPWNIFQTVCVNNGDTEALAVISSVEVRWSKRRILLRLRLDNVGNASEELALFRRRSRCNVKSVNSQAG